MDRAGQLLKSIDEAGGLDSYKLKSNVSLWNAALVLYRRENPRNRVRKGCESCIKVIYDWLKVNA